MHLFFSGKVILNIVNIDASGKKTVQLVYSVIIPYNITKD